MHPSFTSRVHAIHGWAIWIISILFLFYKFILEVSPSVMTQELMRYFSISGAELGHLAASYFYAYFIMQIPVGMLIDRFGPRRITTSAIIFCGIGSILFAYSHSFLGAAVSRFLIGAGASLAAVNAFKLLANWFPKKWYAFMTGLSMTIAMMGAVCGQAPLAGFIDVVGWHTCLYYLGIGGIGLGIFFYFIVRDYPKGVDLLHSAKKTRFLHGLSKICKNPQNWIVSLFSGLAFAPVSALGGLWGVPFLQEVYGLSKSLAAQNISLVFIGFAVGAPLFGWFSNLLGKRKPIILIGTGIAFILCFSMIYLNELIQPILFIVSFLFGFFMSSFLLSFTIIHEMNTPLVTGTTFGLMNAFNALFGAVSDPLIGKFLDLNWGGALENGARIYSVSDYHWGLAILPSYLLMALFFALFTKETHCKQIE